MNIIYKIRGKEVSKEHFVALNINVIGNTARKAILMKIDKLLKLKDASDSIICAEIVRDDLVTLKASVDNTSDSIDAIINGLV